MNEPAAEKDLQYEHYRLCFWIGFLILGTVASPFFMFMRFRPLSIIHMLIGCSIYFAIGGTIGGLATLVVGYPLQVMCDKLSWSREQRRWFLAFAVPFVTMAALTSLFTHRANFWDPALALLKIALPVSLVFCAIIFSYDKFRSKVPLQAKLSVKVKTLLALGIGASAFIAICFFGPMNRGTPQLYDYATEIVDPSRLRTNFGKVRELQYPNLWYIKGNEHFVDDKLVDMPAFKEFEDVTYAELAPTKLNDGRLLQIQSQNGNHIFIFDSSGKNGVVGPLVTDNKYGSSEVVLDDGRVLFIGGQVNKEPVDIVEAFDPSNMTLKQVGKLNIARHSHKSLKLHNGNVIVIGGVTSHSNSDAAENQTSTIELIDTKAMSAKVVGQLHKARISALAYPFESDKALIFRGQFDDEASDMKPIGGEDVREFELYTGKSTESKKRMYPPDYWLWGFVDALRGISRK